MLHVRRTSAINIDDDQASILEEKEEKLNLEATQDIDDLFKSQVDQDKDLDGDTKMINDDGARQKNLSFSQQEKLNTDIYAKRHQQSELLAKKNMDEQE